MPPTPRKTPLKTIEQVVEELGLYPLEAFEFVHRGLRHAVTTVHGEQPSQGQDPPRAAASAGSAARAPGAQAPAPDSHHVSGQQLCLALRDLALSQWGYLARTVLRRWNITSTYDFGRIVFALVDNGLMSTSQQDTIDDFRGVYDFNTAFETDYRIQCRP